MKKDESQLRRPSEIEDQKEMAPPPALSYTEMTTEEIEERLGKTKSEALKVIEGHESESLSAEAVKRIFANLDEDDIQSRELIALYDNIYSVEGKKGVSDAYVFDLIETFLTRLMNNYDESAPVSQRIEFLENAEKLVKGVSKKYFKIGSEFIFSMQDNLQARAARILNSLESQNKNSVEDIYNMIALSQKYGLEQLNSKVADTARELRRARELISRGVEVLTDQKYISQREKNEQLIIAKNLNEFAKKFHVEIPELEEFASYNATKINAIIKALEESSNSGDFNKMWGILSKEVKNRMLLLERVSPFGYLKVPNMHGIKLHLDEYLETIKGALDMTARKRIDVVAGKKVKDVVNSINADPKSIATRVGELLADYESLKRLFGNKDMVKKRFKNAMLPIFEAEFDRSFEYENKHRNDPYYEAVSKSIQRLRSFYNL